MLDDRIGDPNAESASDPPEGAGGGTATGMALESPSLEEAAASDPPEGAGGGGGGGVEV
jgi:hypothetical protein